MSLRWKLLWMKQEDPVIINSLWIGPELGTLELLTLHSFLDQGYRFSLWVYEEPQGIPRHPVLSVRDAREILDPSRIFRYAHKNRFGHGQHSVAGFSDLFRAFLLHREGGWWSDMDVCCIGNLPEDEPFVFRSHHHLAAVGNVMQCPAGSDLMGEYAQQLNAVLHAENRDWMLPLRLLNEGIKKHSLSHRIQKFSNTDSWFEIRKLLKPPAAPLPEHWKVIHWNLTDWIALDIPRNVALPGSWYEQLLRQHQVPHQVPDGSGIRQLKKQLRLSSTILRVVRNRLRP